MYVRIEEGLIKGAKEPVPIYKTDLKEMGKCICKINGNKIGTGFFCRINYLDYSIPVLITNNHVIDENFMELKNQLKVYINDESYIIGINKKNIIYSSERNKYDIIIIKLREGEIKNFLQIDQNIFKFNSENLYLDEQIFILHFPNIGEAKVSYACGIEKINDYDIKHKCNTEVGSSGGPIFSAITKRIIGIHKGAISNRERKTVYNIGTFLKFPLNDLNLGLNIKQILSSEEYPEIKTLIKNLYTKKLLSNIVQIKGIKKIFGSDLIGYQLLCDEKFLPKDYSTTCKNWISAWHGTKFEYLESIIKYGFQLPGTKLKDGTIITQNFDITNKEVKGIKNWEKAIFASPDFAGAFHYTNELGNYNCFIEVKIKPGSFTQHYRRDYDSLLHCCSVQDELEKYSDFTIYRIPSEKNIIIKSILCIDSYQKAYIWDMAGRKGNEKEILKKYGYLD